MDRHGVRVCQLVQLEEVIGDLLRVVHEDAQFLVLQRETGHDTDAAVEDLLVVVVAELPVCGSGVCYPVAHHANALHQL